MVLLENTKTSGMLLIIHRLNIIGINISKIRQLKKEETFLEVASNNLKSDVIYCKNVDLLKNMEVR